MRRITPITNANILVIGAGVSGLTTAICLRQAGFDVTVTAENFTPNLTSTVAGALWEWPPAVCGHHGAPRSLKRSKQWCMTSYQKFKQIHTDFWLKGNWHLPKGCVFLLQGYPGKSTL